MFSVYVLYSATLNRYYTGATNNVSLRMEEHNSVKYVDAYTSKGRPWILYLSIDNLTSAQSYKIEKYIKSMKSSAYIRSLKLDPNIQRLREKFASS